MPIPTQIKHLLPLFFNLTTKILFKQIDFSTILKNKINGRETTHYHHLQTKKRRFTFLEGKFNLYQMTKKIRDFNFVSDVFGCGS